MDVEELLQQHGMFAGMVKKMGGSKGMLNQMKKNAAGRGGGNPMGQMSKMLPPGMMEQMGGMNEGVIGRDGRYTGDDGADGDDERRGDA
jgi:hypothetical protein